MLDLIGFEVICISTCYKNCKIKTEVSKVLT